MYLRVLLATTLLFVEARLAASFSANGRAEHQVVRNAARESDLAAAALVTAPLTVFQDSYYLLNVSIGTPGEEHIVLRPYELQSGLSLVVGA